MLVNDYITNDNLHSIRTMDILDGRISLRLDIKNDLKINEIDPMVQKIIAETNSHFYKSAIGKLKEYTIPEFPILTKDRKLLLDLGCGWGRWSFSANKSGFISIGVDPCIDSIMSANRISKQLNLKSKFVVGDARYLPFKKNLFDNSFSFSVLQHFKKNDVKKILEEINYTLKIGGTSQMHMLNKYGIRSLTMQIKHKLQKYSYFQTTYWSPKELIMLFNDKIGFSKLNYLSFFTQAQTNDYSLFTFLHKFIFNISQSLINISKHFPFIKYLADNVYVISKKKNEK